MSFHPYPGLLAVLVMTVCCGTSDGPKIHGTDVHPFCDAVCADLKTDELCQPICNEESECGDDGCGGSCGNCVFATEMCTDESKCVPYPCDSTKDCPGELVCAKELHECAVCNVDADCVGDRLCGPDHQCHNEVDCASDKDCKDYGMVCDMAAAVCVECLGPEDCQDNEYCEMRYCWDDTCTVGDVICQGNEVWTCNEEGSAKELTETCTDSQYCEGGDCHDLVCTPKGTWCDGDVLKTCSDDGTAIESETDCAAEDKVCQDAQCMNLVCTPKSTWCEGSFATALCADDGMSSTVQLCPAEHYCEDGSCFPQVCDPGKVFCDGEVHKVCSEKGSEVTFEEDCAAKNQHCHQGVCLDTICPPNELFCQDDSTKAVCADDGMSSTPEACPAQHYCDDGDTVQCLPWVCTPGQAFCDDDAAKICNSKGSAVSNEIACGDSVCVGGECVEQVCVPASSFCVDDTTVGVCSADGLFFEPNNCASQHSCLDGKCEPWLCEPAQAVCDGTIAAMCDDLGLGFVQGGTDCDLLGKFCEGGQCVECQPQCVGMECGDNGCGGTCGQCGVGQACIFGKCPGPGMECDDTNNVDWDGCTEGKITEFMVNTKGSYPSVAGTADGGFVLGWQEGGQWGQEHVFARRYGNSGASITNKFMVSSTVSSYQKQLQIAARSDGSVVMAWWGYTGAGVGEALVRLFDLASNPLGPEVLANSTVQGMQFNPALAVFSDNEFVVMWTDNSGQDGSSDGVFGQLLDANALSVGEEFQVNSHAEGSQGGTVRMATLPDDSVVAVWNDHSGQDGSQGGVFGQRLAKDGSKLGEEFQVNTTTEGSQGAPDVCRAAGGFVAVWSSPEDDVLAQRFAADGTLLGGEFVVNTFISGCQQSSSVAHLDDGGFIVVWISNEQDGSSFGIFGQRFTSDGAEVGPELQINTQTMGQQASPDVAGLAGGGFVTVWIDGSQMNSGVFAQRFDNDGNKLYH